VEMGDQDHPDVRQSGGAHELSLRALSTIDENPLAPPYQQLGGRTPLHGGHGAGGTQEHKL
jgi:hypothetical protein